MVAEIVIHWSRAVNLACVAFLAGAGAAAGLAAFLKKACTATGLAAGAAFMAVLLLRLAPRNSVRMAVCMAADDAVSGLLRREECRGRQDLR